MHEAKGGEHMNMNQKELDARNLLEQLNRLPEDVRQRVGYIIQGAVLIVDSRKENGPADKAG